jgi:hypothetical protein
MACQIYAFRTANMIEKSIGAPLEKRHKISGTTCICRSVDEINISRLFFNSPLPQIPLGHKLGHNP